MGRRSQNRFRGLLPLGVLLAAIVVVASVSAAPSIDTRITGGPPSFSLSRSPSISFASVPSGAGFECSFDGAAYTACSSPLQLANLALGSHALLVRAVAPSGARDRTPARFAWRIVSDLNPPVVEIAGVPASGRVRLSLLRNLHGTAHAAAGIKSVEVALRVWGIRRQPSLYSPTYCLFANLHKGKVRASPCLQPLWTAARGGTHWRLRMARKAVARLPRVDYELQVRAINAAGEGVVVRRKLDIQG